MLTNNQRQHFKYQKSPKFQSQNKPYRKPKTNRVLTQTYTKQNVAASEKKMTKKGKQKEIKTNGFNS
jgi:hypothetical protein